MTTVIAAFCPTQRRDARRRTAKAEGVMKALYRRAAGPGVVMLLECEAVYAI